METPVDLSCDIRHKTDKILTRFNDRNIASRNFKYSIFSRLREVIKTILIPLAALLGAEAATSRKMLLLELYRLLRTSIYAILKRILTVVVLR